MLRSREEGCSLTNHHSQTRQDAHDRGRLHGHADLRGHRAPTALYRGDDPDGLPGSPPFVRAADPLRKTLVGRDIRQEHATVTAWVGCASGDDIPAPMMSPWNADAFTKSGTAMAT